MDVCIVQPVGHLKAEVISPILANLYLHYVLDEWYDQVVKSHLRGGTFIIRYADDFVIGFTNEDDAR